MFASLVAFSLLIRPFVAAQSSSTAVVCVAGQCLEGFSNITIGTTISAPDAPAKLLLLPGQYTDDSNPELLHDLLTSTSASLSPSIGFSNSSATTLSVSLPLTIALQPGLATYPQSLFSGQAAFVELPSAPARNASPVPFSAGSISVSSNVWAAVSSRLSNDRTIIWESIPDITQLPSGGFSSTLELLDMQSSTCSPPCSGSGVCTPSGTCTCPPGFTGTSCENCASGFFGATCQACPAGCTECDDGITGSGRCLVPQVTNPPSSCNCLNGVCGSNGQCTCNAGWTTASNGTACAQCETGFFLTEGNCQACSLGCTQCADSSGDCISCKSGFTQDANDATQCIAPQTTTSTGTLCPDGSFSNGTACAPCSPECQTCSGPDSSDCIICGAGKFSANGSCVSTSGSGVCQGSNLIANNNKHECDSCPAKCTACEIPNFTVASTINEAQCTGCLPGFVLSEGQCVESCPTGTFLSPQDNLTCTACDSTCDTCFGSATFCLSCANNQLASNGQCVASCPSNTFSSSGSCISCHPDCASCSGASFTQCSSCASNLPVLTSGRCLPTCSQSQFFDTTSSSCQSCDSSCSSCSGTGSSNCLACSSSDQVLRGGSCVAANCNSSSSVVPGLGACLSELVVVPPASGTSSVPLPTITGINSPTVIVTKSNILPWWQILLMALGCAFIFLVVMMLWRRRARKARAKRTAAFASAKALDHKPNWRWRLVRFGERLFGHRASKQADPESGDIKLSRMRDAEDARHNAEMEKLIGAYEHSRASRAPSPLPSLDNYNMHRHSTSGESSHSLYSQVTGMPRRGPDPRQPVKDRHDGMNSRFSTTTSGSSKYGKSPGRELTPAHPPSVAEEYAMSVRAPEQAKGSYWLEPTHTGGSGSKNPFRK